MAYTTKVKISSGRFAGKLGKRRNYTSKKWRSKTAASGKKGRFAFLKSEKFKKVALSAGAFMLILVIIAAVIGLSCLQSVTEDLPSPDKPFGKRSAASEIYDRNGKLLYRKTGNENSDPVKLEEVPHLLKWAFLAAEDIDFYQHPGVDVVGLLRCGIRNLSSGGISCGGSTITQQIIKPVVEKESKSTMERKVKEIIMALQIERERSKDEILEIYLTAAPEGSNIYGVKTAAQFYFGKELKDLNLAEMAILASIPQNPVYLSPTKAANQEQAQKRVKERQMYVLQQMENYKDKINNYYKEQTGSDQDLVTQEMIDEAREFPLEYKKPTFEIKAPHFVFYVLKIMQERGYKDGIPFGLTDIETGGYKIYTTLDLDFQTIAEEQVKKGVDNYGKRYGAENAALVALNPQKGEVLAMVGSKDYFGEPTPKGCTLGISCRFEPNVNITDTLQSFGSSMKPMVYYEAIMKGLITPGSQLADVPIKIGNYTPKNYEGGFIGINSARYMLGQSRNIPAIYLVNMMGVDNYVNEMKKWGYTTFTNPQGYGPAISVGGGDVKMIEHAQGYGVLANGGKFIQHEVVLKIVDRDGKEIFNYEPKSEQVADERGVFLVNDILNGRKGGPGDSWDGRDISGKTGTSEAQRETWFATYTPEIVAVGWLGNNNNDGMRFGASGFTSARPWVAEFVKRIGGSIPKTAFARPSGITSAGGCAAEEGSSCSGIGGSDLAIAGIKVPSYVTVGTVTVCTDQPNRLARDIDIAVGKSKTIQYKYYKMPDPKLQGFLDDWVGKNPEIGVNGKPTEYCDIDRNPGGGTTPWVTLTSPANGTIITDSINVQFNAFSPTSTVNRVEVRYDGNLLTNATTLPYSNTFNVGSQTPGTHTLSLKVVDNAGESSTTNISLEVLGVLTITSPADGSSANRNTNFNVSYNYTGSTLSSAALFVGGTQVAVCSATCTWAIPNDYALGSVQFFVRGVKNGQQIDSAARNVNIAP